MNFPTNLAQLKRYLKENQNKIKLTLIEFHLNGNPNAQHKFKNVPRSLTTVNSVGFGLSDSNAESFCDWPKSALLELDASKKQFTIRDSTIKLVYQVEE